MNRKGPEAPAPAGGAPRREEGGRLLAAVLSSPPVRTSAGIMAALVVAGITVRLLRGTCSWPTAALGYLVGAAFLAFAFRAAPRPAEERDAPAPQEARPAPPGGWSLAARRIEQQKARDFLLKLHAQRALRPGTPQAIWRAEMEDLRAYVAARLKEMGASPPPDLLQRIQEMDRTAVLGKDYPGRMATALAAFIERLCPFPR